MGFYNYKKKAALARLEALENDNAGIETVEMNDDDEASLDDDDQGLFFSLYVEVYEIFRINTKRAFDLLKIMSHAWHCKLKVESFGS